MEVSFSFIVLVIVVALAFDFMNGFHDAANSIATVVSTQVLRPQWAVVWAAFFNFAAFMVFDLHVATTIGKGVVDPAIIDPIIVFAGLVGALLWNIITWLYGIPSSSSHALIGGLAGAGVAKGGIRVLQSDAFIKAGSAIVLSPLLGMAMAILLTVLSAHIFFRTAPRKVDKLFRRLQFVSASLFSLGHGGNDAQKTMGIIAALLASAKLNHSGHFVPFWVVISCHVMIGLGTLFGGWKIVETMGMKITKLKPIGGFCAETSAATMLFAASSLGVPVSTTHTITGAIMGVGSVNKFSAVRWGVAERIVWAWLITIPASAFVAAITWMVTRQFFHG